jgi:hypothetical protein
MIIEDETYLSHKFIIITNATIANTFHEFIKIATYSPHVNESQGMEQTISQTRNNVQTCNNNKKK